MKKRTSGWTRNLALGLVVLGCAGCSTLLVSPQNAKTKREIAQAEYWTGRGLYQEAAAAYERTLTKPLEPQWREKILFNLGRLYALNDNPGRDFGRSLSCLRQLRQEFPRGRFKAEAQVWAGLLEELVSLEMELAARKAEWSAEVGLKGRKLEELESLIQTQKTAIDTLQQQLKKMKEIDIQSEKKAKGIK